jgi:hypothetical protein
VRIYISSTFRDLQKHRQAVSVVLRRMGHQPVGMEEYVAEGMRPLNRCLADIQACDAYVGIVAWRYGYVPAESGAANTPLPVGTALGKTSITEFEFRQAVQCGKPVLMFVLDPEAEWPSVQFDAVAGDGDQGKAIKELRSDVEQQYLVSYFRTAEELASLVSAGIYRLEMSRQMTLESLRIEPKFNQPFIRNGPVEDSTLMEIKSVIAGPQKIQGLQIDIGQGHDWWMTRLYFLSSLAADLARIEVMVFVVQAETFCGIVNPRIVKDRLADAYPMLRQYEGVLSRSGPQQADLVGEIDRRAAIWTSHMKAAGEEHSIATFVTSQELDRWLSPYWITLAVELQPTESGALQMQRLIDWPMRFVPVVQNGQFVRVVDKLALTEQIARLYVREQVSRALSMTR